MNPSTQCMLKLRMEFVYHLACIWHDAITRVAMPTCPNHCGQTVFFVCIFCLCPFKYHFCLGNLRKLFIRTTYLRAKFRTNFGIGGPFKRHTSLAQHCLTAARTFHIDITSAVTSLCKTGYLLTKLATCCWSILSFTLLQVSCQLPGQLH